MTLPEMFTLFSDKSIAQVMKAQAGLLHGKWPYGPVFTTVTMHTK